ncbi:MAG: MFS transporter [Promethearchaeota archaeon]
MEEQNMQNYDENGLASDFQNLIKIARWNYVGIPFIEFLTPYFSKDILNASATEIGLIISAVLLGVILSSAVTGYLTKKVGSKKLMVIACFGRGISYLAIYFSFIFGSIISLIVAEFVKGVFTGTYEVSFEVFVADKSHKSKRSYAFGKVVSNKGIIFFIGGLLSFTAYGVLNYFELYHFLQLSPMILFSAILILTGFRIKSKVAGNNLAYVKNSKENNHELEDLTTITTNKPKIPKAFVLGFILIFLSLFLTSLNDFITHPFIQVYLLEVLDSSFVFVLLAYTPGALISYILAPLFGKVADKINPYWGITIVSVAGAALTLWLINVSQVWMFSIIFLLDRGFALTGALLVKSFVSRLSVEKRGINLGFSWSIANIGGVVGPVIGGILYDSFNPTMPFIISIFVELGLIIFYIVGIYTSRDFMAEPLFKDEISIQTEDINRESENTIS